MFDTKIVSQLKSQAHIWLAVPEHITDAEVLSESRRLLSENELARYQRFHFDKDKHIFLVSHALLRRVLSNYAEVAPEHWQFDLNTHGRPELSRIHALPWLRFNLSHTEGLIACLVTDSMDCGIDVENLTRRCDYKGVARKMFSAEENACLEQLAYKQQPDRFFRYWTLKEAYVKARGLGLSLPTKKIEFNFEDTEKVYARFDPGIEDDKRDWQFTLHQPTPSHVMATAVRCGDNAAFEVVLKNNLSGNGI